jgi:hypothetical protein
MDSSITTNAWASPSALPRVAGAAMLGVSLLLIIVGSAYDLLDLPVLTGLAVVLLPLSVRNLVSGNVPRWVGGLGLAVAATVIVHAVGTWSL